MKIAKKIKLSQIVTVFLIAVIGMATLITSIPKTSNAAIINQKYRFIDTNYAIPSTNVIIVDPNGSDTNGDGSQLKPYQTLTKAVSVATTGATIVMNAGIYRQPITTVTTNNITIQAAPHAEVWIKGSRVVSNWTQSGSTWIASGWAPSFCNTCTTNPDSTVEGMAAYPAQVFINDQPLTEVTSQAAVGANQFYIDTAGQRVIIGNNPSGQTVEVSENQRAFTVTGSDFKMLGVNVSQYAPQQAWATGSQPNYVGPAQLYIVGDGALIENCIIAQSSAVGLSLSTGANMTVRNSQFLDDGSNGISANRTDGLTIQNNKFIANNAAGFNVTSCTSWCTVSDIKITHAMNLTFSGNLLANTNANGFWCDEGCINTNVINNFVSGEGLEGLFYEVSSQAIIAGNIVEGSVNGGITVGGSDHVQIYNNTLSRNRRNLRVYEDPRAASCNTYVVGTGCTSPESWSQSHGLSWSTTNMVVRNNIFSRDMATASLETQLVRFQGIVRQDNTQLWAGGMLDAMDHNGYFSDTNNTAANRYHTVWYATSTPTIYSSVAAFLAGTGYGANSVDLRSAGANPDFVSEGPTLTSLQVSNYNLTAGSTMRNSGYPLPTDVATALGWTAGVAVNMGALNNQYISMPLAVAPQLQAMINLPIVGATLSGTTNLTVNLAHDNPINRVEYYAGSTLVGTSTSSPYSLSWNTSSVSNGDYALTAKVYDSLSNSATSSAVYVTVDNGAVASAPQNLTLTPGSSQITASWIAPANIGGSPIINYVAAISADGGTTWLQTQTVTGLSYTFSGLNSGVTYTVQVYAVNSAGNGAVVSADGRPAYVTLTMPGTNPTISVMPGSTPSFSSVSYSPSVESNTSYQMTLSTSSTVTALTSGANTIPASTGTITSPTTLAADTWGFRVDGLGGFGAGPTIGSSNAAALPGTWAGVPSSANAAVIASGAATTGQAVNIWFGLGASNAKPSGTYSQTLVITVVGS